MRVWSVKSCHRTSACISGGIGKTPQAHLARRERRKAFRKTHILHLSHDVPNARYVRLFFDGKGEVIFFYSLRGSRKRLPQLTGLPVHRDWWRIEQGEAGVVQMPSLILGQGVFTELRFCRLGRHSHRQVPFLTPYVRFKHMLFGASMTY